MNLVRVPKVAEAVTEGTVVRWHVSVGERVRSGQPLVEMITEKAEGDVYAPDDGRVALIAAPERSTVPVGYVLCALAEESEELPDIGAMNDAILERHRTDLFGVPPEPAAGASPATEPPPPTATGSKVQATPAARRLARERGLDLARLATEAGIAGKITEADVRRHLACRNSDGGS